MNLAIPFVFVGAGVGGVARYLLSAWLQGVARGAFPVGTLVVNVTGCLLIGLLAAGALSGGAMSREDVRLGLVVGVLGGYTTMSSFGLETVRLMGEGRAGAALAYVLLTNGLGLAAVWAGLRVGRSLG